MIYRPRVVYDGTTINLSISQRLWLIKNRSIGGFGIASAGVQESFVIRRDNLAQIRLRFTESEWYSIIQPWLEWAQGHAGSTFVFRFDQDDIGTEYTVYLDEPHAGEDIEPERDDHGDYSLDIILRAVNPSKFSIVAY